MIELLFEFWRETLHKTRPRPTPKKPADPRARRRAAAMAAAVMRETAARNAFWRRERAIYEQDQRKHLEARRNAQSWPSPLPAPAYPNRPTRSSTRRCV